MEYTIKSESKFQKLRKQLQSKTEDIFLSSALCLAKITKSEKLSAWIERNTEKKMQQLQQEIIRQKWDLITLQKASESIHKM